MLNKTKDIINKYHLLDLMFILSVPMLSLVLANRCELKDITITIILSFIVGIIVKFTVLKNIYKNMNKKFLLISTYISLYFMQIAVRHCKDNLTYMHNLLGKVHISLTDVNTKNLFVCFAIFSTITLVYTFLTLIIPYLRKEYQKLSKSEKVYLGITILVAFFLTCIIYNSTSVFYTPLYNEERAHYGDIYTSDSGRLFESNTFLLINTLDNDFKQSLFGLCSLPFSLVAKWLSDILFFIPNIYAILLTTISIFALALAILMLTKILNLKGNQKLFFILITLSTFPFILFSFIIEQYIFSLFYLIFAIYYHDTNKEKINYPYIGAVGTLITSGIIFPCISKFHNIKQWVKDVFKCFLAYITTVTLSGQITKFLHIDYYFSNYCGFLGTDLTFLNKFQQFTYFVRSLFIAPESAIVLNPKGFPAYRLCEIHHISILGILLLALCIISCIINRDKLIAKLSGVWVLFSFVLLCLVGWGTAENGLILYSLYFSWAYIILLFLLLNKIKNNTIKTIIFILITVLLLVTNIPEFINIINFGLTHYKIIL